MDKKTMALAVKYLGLAICIGIVAEMVIAVATGHSEKAIDDLSTLAFGALAALAGILQHERS